ncbi:bacillolysin [Providencia sneebia]|uniref:Neutral metalloproteinase n=1 Tax=Providencia sneebia DSM 19967 TaxID=1141660 RepID=K8WE08_9GAMM|nr:bacillolysin [Providencia sneebia DSM 19967]
MKHSLNRTIIPSYLLDQLYQESQCPNLKSTLMHTNALMNKHNYDEDLNQLPHSFFSSTRPKANYERIIRDAKGQFEIPDHAHSKAPICYQINLALENQNIKPHIVHMPHEDYEIIMVEGNINYRDNAAKIVYDSIGHVRSFYKEVLGIDKMFGCDAHINAVIHFGDSFANAFWNSQAIYFGDGDNKYFNPFYNDIDVIAHELTHGLITFTTRFFIILSLVRLMNQLQISSASW